MIAWCAGYAGSPVSLFEHAVAAHRPSFNVRRPHTRSVRERTNDVRSNDERPRPSAVSAIQNRKSEMTWAVSMIIYCVPRTPLVQQLIDMSAVFGKVPQ